MCPQCLRAHLHAVVSIKLKQRQLWPCKIFLWLWRYYQLKLCSNGRGQQCLEFLTSVLPVECTRMQQLPTMLVPAVHYGKDTTCKTLKTMCNPRAWPQHFVVQLLQWLPICFVFSTPTQRCTLSYCISPACLTSITPWKMQKQVSILSKCRVWVKTLFTHGSFIK